MLAHGSPPELVYPLAAGGISVLAYLVLSYFFLCLTSNYFFQGYSPCKANSVLELDPN